MKAGIHPNYNEDVTVTCSCGNTFVTGSTEKDIHVEICAACHPFFTGEVKYVDLAGRVDKFAAKLEKAKAAQSSKKSKKSKTTTSDDTQNQTLKEMLKGAKKNIAKSTKPSAKTDDSSSSNDTSTSDDDSQ